MKQLCLALFTTIMLVACGSDSDSELSGIYSVNDVNILSNDIDIGEQARTEIFFETKTEIDGSPDGLQVVVRIPAELSFVPGSSQLYDGSTNDSDSYTPSNIVKCPTGETYLTYNFSDFDLFQHELAETGRFGLKFLIQGVTPTPQTLVGASAAGDVVGFDCGEFFDAEQNEAVEVLR